MCVFPNASDLSYNMLNGLFIDQYPQEEMVIHKKIKRGASTHQLVGHQVDDATHIEKNGLYICIIEKCIKITVDTLKYGIGNVTK